MAEVIDVELEIETPADDPINLQLSAVSSTVRSRYDAKRMVGPLSYQIVRTRDRWGWNPLRWLRGPQQVHVWRAWFRYRRGE